MIFLTVVLHSASKMYRIMMIASCIEGWATLRMNSMIEMTRTKDDVPADPLDWY